jgi:hypothetical protein
MTATLPSTSHTVRLSGTDWEIWRLSALRSTGFPVDLARVVADTRVAAAADDDSVEQAAFDDEYAAAWQRFSDAMAELARDRRFREAITWQSPHLVEICLDRVAKAPDFGGRLPSARSQHRQYLATLANYAQRYALKNDSIGFFGPVGWATWTDRPEALTVTPGRDLVARRSVYFEVWAVQALALALTSDSVLRTALPVRRSPENFVADGQVTSPAGKRVELSPAHARVMAACDGALSADGLAGRAGVDRAVVESLIERELLLADPEITYCAHPEEQLHRLLTGLPDCPARAAAVATLENITRARDAIAAAAGDPDELATAMARLATLFTDATGQAATRNAGQTYAGRTLVYEDTIRDVRVELGIGLMDRIGPALELLLSGARWLAWRVGAGYEARFRAAFTRLCERTGRAEVPLGRLLGSLTPDLVFSRATLPSLVTECVEEFQRKWADVLRIPESAEQHHVRAGDIRDEVLAAFDCPEVPWRAARQHSPDIMLAAADAEAVRSGDFLAVLGEAHVSVNTLQSRLFVEQSPDPAALVAAEAADHGSGRLVSLPSMRSQGVNSRTHPSALHAPEFTYWTMYPDVADRPGPVVPAGALEVVDREGRLTVVSRADGREWDLLEVVGESLSWVAMNGFAPVPGRNGRKPRVSVDSLVFTRASWKVPVALLGWERLTGGARYRAARRWRRAAGVPERCFYRLGVEDKPQFVDFSSVALVDVLARGLRNLGEADPGASVGFSEMLPDLGQSWLTDEDGRRYAAEIRIVAVDQRKGQ